MKIIEKIRVKVVADVSDLNKHSGGVVVSALNLNTYSILRSKYYNGSKIIFWPDGIYSKVVCGLKVKKYPGRRLLDNILNDTDFSNKKMFIIGGESSCVEVIKDKYNLDISHIELPFMPVEELYGFVCHKLVDDSNVIIALPTPKQDELAMILIKSFSKNKYYCIGGALNMLCYKEKPCPDMVSDIGLEWIWRLRSEPIHRIKRLFSMLINICKFPILKIKCK